VVAALALTALAMIALAYVIERVVLRPLVNQEPIILFMATIGLNFFLEGFGEMAWAAQRQEARHRASRHVVHRARRADQPAGAGPRP